MGPAQPMEMVGVTSVKGTRVEGSRVKDCCPLSWGPAFTVRAQQASSRIGHGRSISPFMCVSVFRELGSWGFRGVGSRCLSAGALGGLGAEYGVSVGGWCHSQGCPPLKRAVIWRMSCCKTGIMGCDSVSGSDRGRAATKACEI